MVLQSRPSTTGPPFPECVGFVRRHQPSNGHSPTPPISLTKVPKRFLATFVTAHHAQKTNNEWLNLDTGTSPCASRTSAQEQLYREGSQ